MSTISIKHVLLSDDIYMSDKIDLDNLMLTFMAGVDVDVDDVHFVAGSVSQDVLDDPAKLCVEVGGAEDKDAEKQNNFDHHPKPGKAGQTHLSAAAQFFKRLSIVCDYVNYMDTGDREKVELDKAKGFPSLVQLISGMLLVVKDRKERVRHGHQILKAVLRSGINPFEESMERILDRLPHGRAWAAAKKKHEALFTEVLELAEWTKTGRGHKLASVETTWFGAPGALQGSGAVLVVAYNPAMELDDDRIIGKFTIAAHKNSGISVRPLLEKLNAMEVARGGHGTWGGPVDENGEGTIIGSPQGFSSALLLKEVVTVIKEVL